MQDLECISIKNFLRNRYDLVIRYYFIRSNNNRIPYDNNYLSVKFSDQIISALKIVNPRLIQKGLFDSSRWAFVESQISDTKWRQSNPIEINLSSYCFNVKRVLLSVIYKKPIFWSFNLNNPEKSGFSYDQFCNHLSDEVLHALSETANILSQELSALNFGSIQYFIESKYVLSSLIIWGPAENSTNRIIGTVLNKSKLISIFRSNDIDTTSFKTIVNDIYRYDGASIEKVKAKIPFIARKPILMILVVFDRKDNLLKLKKSLRKAIKFNSVHSTDSTFITLTSLSRILNIQHNSALDFINSNILSSFNSVIPHSFSNQYTDKSINFSKSYSTIEEFINTLNSVDDVYAIHSLKSHIMDEILQGKDIEILTLNRSLFVDKLGAIYTKKDNVYSVRISNFDVLLDFSFSHSLPIFWLHQILLTRDYHNGYYSCNSLNTYWITYYDRVFLKPHKFRNNIRYHRVEQWDSIISNINNIGSYPRIKSYLPRFIYKIIFFIRFFSLIKLK